MSEGCGASVAQVPKRIPAAMKLLEKEIDALGAEAGLLEEALVSVSSAGQGTTKAEDCDRAAGVASDLAYLRDKVESVASRLRNTRTNLDL